MVYVCVCAVINFLIHKTRHDEVVLEPLDTQDRRFFIARISTGSPDQDILSTPIGRIHG